MPGKRKITGVKPLFGQSRSKAFNTVKRKFKPNLQNKRIYVPELDRWVRVKITAKELKTIDKIGFMEFLKRRGIPLKQLDLASVPRDVGATAQRMNQISIAPSWNASKRAEPGARQNQPASRTPGHSPPLVWARPMPSAAKSCRISSPKTATCPMPTGAT